MHWLWSWLLNACMQSSDRAVTCTGQITLHVVHHLHSQVTQNSHSGHQSHKGIELIVHRDGVQAA